MLRKSKIALSVMGIVGIVASNVYADGVPGGSMSNNPAFNVVMEGRYVSQDTAEFELPGFQSTSEFEHLGVAPTGFSTGHNEVNMGARITWATSGVISFALENHDGESVVTLEEAYVETKALGKGVIAKAGQFYSGIGNLNTKHEHRQDFANVPLVYLGMFGGHLSDTGVQLRWEKPDTMNLKIGVEMTTGTGYPGGENEDNNAGLAAFAKIGGDIGSTSSWNGGISMYSSDFDARHSGGHHADTAEMFEIENGSVTVTGVDLEYLFSPNGKGEAGELKISMEYFTRDEDGSAMFTDTVTGDVAEADYDGSQSGYYIAAVYRFMPKWRVGMRFDHLESDNKFTNFDNTGWLSLPALDQAGFEDESGLIAEDDPERSTVMVDYAPNQNSVIRLQFMKDEAGHDSEDRIYLQYIVAIGGHGH